MAEPLKNLFHPALIRLMAENLARVSDGFDGELFLRKALHRLDRLELMQRSGQILNALAAAFPPGFEDTVGAMVAALHPATTADISNFKTDRTGIAGWAVMPMAGFVAKFGLDQPDLSLDVLRHMTMRSSSEFAVRPFFRDHPQVTLTAASGWARNENHHVRRLASEGCRPRLPWGIKLHSFVTDPEPILSILTRLRDDPSEYVRRSVANNLNDIAKDHPDLVAAIAVAWLKPGDQNRVRLVRHGCRTLIKDGHSGALAAFGFDVPVLSSCAVTLSSETVTVGDKLEMMLTLRGSDKEQNLLIDYVVHFLRSRGTYSPKVFKWTEISLQPGETRQISKTHVYRKVTTRKDYPGTHRISVRINGMDFDGPEFALSI